MKSLKNDNEQAFGMYLFVLTFNCATLKLAKAQRILRRQLLGRVIRLATSGDSPATRCTTRPTQVLGPRSNS